MAPPNKKLEEEREIVHSVFFCGETCNQYIGYRPYTHINTHISYISIYIDLRIYMFHLVKRLELLWHQNIFVSKPADHM